MGSNGINVTSKIDVAEGSESTIEIKIKTLDSQTYTLRVNKQMPVPALKEQIASLTGVLTEQQRLICRGKVLKDDQLLSAYHIEDGHTLHLVVRQPLPASSDGAPAFGATDPSTGASHSHSSRATPSVVIETFNVPDRGEGVPPEISRIVSAVLGSFGIPNIGNSSEGRLERTSTAGNVVDLNQMHSEQPSIGGLSDRWSSAFGVPTSVSLGQPPVITDSLTTMSQYLNHMRSEFDDIGMRNWGGFQAASREEGGRESNSASNRGAREGLPTPGALSELMLSTREMLTGQVAECLRLFSSQLENQDNITDPSLRSSTQNNAMRIGMLFHNLGAYILELGRTAMTLRLGQTPSEAVVNAGPAIYISPAGPNPLMVQPLPFQPGTRFSNVPVGAVHPGSNMGSTLSSRFLPRRIDIQIRRGSPTTTMSNTGEERGDSQQPARPINAVANSGEENIVSHLPSSSSEPPAPPVGGESGVRVVPIRTMVAAVPASFSRLPSDSSNNSMGIYCPLIGRMQHVAPGNVTIERGSHASNEQQPTVIETAQQPIPESNLQNQNIEDARRDGSSILHSGGQEASTSRSININILSSSGSQTISESGEQVRGSVIQFLRNLFPGGEIHFGSREGTPVGTPVGSSSMDTQMANNTAHTPEPETRVSDDAIFFSNMLQQIMPLISQDANNETNTRNNEANPSRRRLSEDSNLQSPAGVSDAGTSRGNDGPPSPPNSKRQKTE